MNAAREKYLNDQVLTAPPQKLQLMLIDGAIRFGLQARTLWNEDRGAEACEALVRSQEIVVELMNVARQSGHELGQQAARIYLFAFQRLVASSIERGGQPLADALRVLAEERETWRMVCEQFGTQQQPAAAPVVPAAVAPAAPAAPHFGGWNGAPSGVPETGISFQA